jgi:hypothetical protein
VYVAAPPMRPAPRPHQAQPCRSRAPAAMLRHPADILSSDAGTKPGARAGLVRAFGWINPDVPNCIPQHLISNERIGIAANLPVYQKRSNPRANGHPTDLSQSFCVIVTRCCCCCCCFFFL